MNTTHDMSMFSVSTFVTSPQLWIEIIDHQIFFQGSDSFFFMVPSTLDQFHHSFLFLLNVLREYLTTMIFFMRQHQATSFLYYFNKICLSATQYLISGHICDLFVSWHFEWHTNTYMWDIHDKNTCCYLWLLGTLIITYIVMPVIWLVEPWRSWQT